MGKKVSKSSIKICKDEKKQFNSLIEMLRPKVYITDTLNFKSLVHELTGNVTPLNSYYLPSVEPETSYYQNIPVIDLEYDRADVATLEPPSIQRVGGSSELELSDQSSSDEVSLDMGQLVDDWLVCSDLETWLLDMEDDDCAFDGYCGPNLAENLGL